MVSCGAAHTNGGDGMKRSLWENKNKLPQYAPLEQDLEADILIVGGGMAGLLCADRLRREGADCVLIEADRILRGVTGNTTAKITSQHGFCYERLLREFGTEKARGYWQANELAIREYAHLAQTIDCDFQRVDNLIYATDSAEKARKEFKALCKLGIPGEWEDAVPLPVKSAGAIRFRDQAQFDPLKFAAGLLPGLRIYERTPAREFIDTTVITDRGKIRAKKIIMATHFPILNKHGGYFLKMYQQRSYVLALENAGQVDGMYLGEGTAGLSFRQAGDLLLLGGGGHRTGKKGGGWKMLEDAARRYYPEAREKYRWAAQDCMTLDGVPYIGRYSAATENLYVATGFNKWGMTSSMVSAMLLADLVSGRRNPYEEVFSPERSILRPQLLRNLGESALHLLKPTVPRCPHLGCALTWNPWERSWDCPCHGSRFSEEGTLLNDPATGDLKNRKK